MECAQQFIASHPQFAYVLTAPGGKNPIQKRWQENKPSERNQRAAIRHVSKGGNYGIVCGKASGLVVVDHDEYKVGIKFDPHRFALINPDGSIYLKLEPTRTVQTGKGGIHQYFILPPSLWNENRIGDLGNHLDIQMNNSQVIGPGSQTRDGVYTIVSDAPIAHLPDYLLEYITEKVRLRPKGAQPRDRDQRTRTSAPAEATPGQGLVQTGQQVATLQRLVNENNIPGTVRSESAHGVFPCLKPGGPITCPFGATHKSNNAYLTLKEPCKGSGACVVMYRCHSGKCKGKRYPLGILDAREEAWMKDYLQPQVQAQVQEQAEQAGDQAEPEEQTTYGPPFGVLRPDKVVNPKGFGPPEPCPVSPILSLSACYDVIEEEHAYIGHQREVMELPLDPDSDSELRFAHKRLG